ncbi:hypothetical protein WS62_07995 [Burkholderia sp. ABCPW 14]|nr:hypothetical protein WS62_07995 [Burkholderia sp. ABCPW 14]
MSIMNVSRTLRAALCFASAHARRPFYRRAERKRLELAYRDDRVSIERGASGAPCITARSEPAVYFGQGYAMAIDRLWQMDILRREAAGRLAEILGAPALSLDRYHRTLRLDHYAAASVRLVGTEDNTRLSAFSDGVNAAIAQLVRDPVRRPVEFDLLGYSPEPWQPADTFAVLKLMALQLGMNAKYKTLMHELGRAFSADAVDALGARATTHDYATLTGAALARDAIDVPIRAFGQTIDLSGLLPVLGQASATGSNAWVVGGKHTRSGYPILCNDPHLPFMLPAIFHQARLRCTDPDNRFDASGVNVPGLPGLISGHNADVAWGITNSQLDVQDLLLVEPSANAELYPAFEPGVHRDEIRVRGGDAVALTTHFTRLGPSVDAFCRHENERDARRHVVLAWSGLLAAPDVRGLFGLTKARDWPGFRRALADIQSLSLNFMFASRSGDIGFKTVGRVPRRRAGLKHTLAPNDWDGFIEFDALPELLNPPSGVIVNCNNPIADERDDVPLALLWNPSFRAWRVDTLLKAKSTWTVDDMEAVLGDTTNLHARQLLPMLLPLLDAQAGEHVAHAVALLREWDCRDERASPAALVWHRFFKALATAIYGPEFQPFRAYFENGAAATTHLVSRALRGEPSPWIPAPAVFASTVAAAFGDALESLRAAGDRPTWGRHHRLGFTHLLSAALGPLRRWTNIPAVERQGSEMTVSLNAGSPSVIQGAVWSMAASFDASSSFSRTTLLPGQSGDFRSRWYADQFDATTGDGGKLVDFTRIDAV